MEISRDVYVAQKRIKNPIDYVQGTNAIQIAFTFRDYDIASGSTARVYVLRPDKTVEYNEASISGNTVIVQPTTSMFSLPGLSELQIQLLYGDEVLVTFSQPVCVEPNYIDGGEHGENASDIFSDLLIQMQQAVSSANAATAAANTAANRADAAAEAAEQVDVVQLTQRVDEIAGIIPRCLAIKPPDENETEETE